MNNQNEISNEEKLLAHNARTITSADSPLSMKLNLWRY